MKNINNEPTQTTSPSILVVDDEEHILKLYEKEFSEDGYQVKTAKDAKEGIKIAQETQLDLVILDIKMEGKNGLEVLSDFRRINKNLPIILNSAYSTYKSDFQSWLADAYVVKSSNLEELKRKIRELVDF